MADKDDKDGFGLDKDARLARRREDRREGSRPEPLDPPFPYFPIPFDPILARGQVG